jgi:tRNA dimethylallyltransferase
MKKVICIVGPTASGKTELSLSLAEAINAEIINGDSVQLYKELNIGSAKIKPDEMKQVPHHMLSIASIEDDYTVFNFQKDVRTLIDQIQIPLIVGGSGLYIKAALFNYEFEPLEDKIPTLSYEDMVEYIKTHDSKLIIDWQNERRIQAAYRNIASGSLRSQKVRKDEPLYDIYLIYLDLERSILKSRLIKRLDAMIEDGLIEETKDLSRQDLNIIGYREISAYLSGSITLEEAKEKIISTSMKFAKRQKTWFINQMKPHIYQALDPNLKDLVIKDVKAFLGETH